ncbi:Peptidase C19 ubiquitin carboxyl-terminal hydrolase 2 [Macrophomina phaseolina MS6]|uniref:Ubiquitin carboxyl-terminal hydrolase n=2 Tax=Macrophomina phaseolina TaxID=35725 RepID=K2S4T6_MACPH|nr:Peptidase C19 ubiquitin carboxyl-terminal hydrolase 2 [Macrophomina phaseolina MS6]KAH7057143.1 ubiquitin carboxyl-terminal hydrolase-like protein 10 [Macrophomina phaseolina]
MMPGPHIPPAIRRPGDHYYLPPQTHSPVPMNVYGNYYHPAQHHGAHPYYPQQFYPPQYHHPQYQHPLPPRPFPQAPPPQQHSPVVVSSHPHIQSVAPVHRHAVRTPPVAHTHTPPAPLVAHSSTPQPAPSTPSVHSQPLVSPSTPTIAQSTATPPPLSTSSRPSFSSQHAPPSPGLKMPFYPNLPWLSKPEEPFPPKARRQRRRRREQPAASEPGLHLPVRDQAEETAPVEDTTEAQEPTAPSEQETPATSQAQSEADSTHPTTPSSALPPSTPQAQAASGHVRKATIPAVPLVPIKPAVSTSQRKGSAGTSTAEKPGTAGDVLKESDEVGEQQNVASPESEKTTTATSPPKTAPKSWADLVRNKNAAAGHSVSSISGSNGASALNGFTTAKNDSMVDVLRTYNVNANSKIAFIEPRGLVNTGNMCYMNSILQTLVFCIPFYNFLDQVGKRAAYSFKSETPLLDAMIMFMREFPIIDSADSEEQLRLRLKDTELEKYGDAFIPEFVYDVIKRLPRFSHMRRGHQQDAEEFLGFILAGLHDECGHIMKSAPASASTTTEPTSPSGTEPDQAEGWLEVGPKQKPSVTRSSGTVGSETPITKIFGGMFRSEIRAPGEKPSITKEPFQPLQLDIGAPHVNNIVDAMKALTRPEPVDYKSSRGPNIMAMKQVFIDTLPSVLILHLKRFQYDNTGGTQKIWKKVGYPLDLELPKEVFPQHKRPGLSVKGGEPKYRLTGVIYHHGKTASGGHYTVDVRRQDGREWIRMDDTILRRIRSEDVAEGGSEEDPRILAKALEQHKADRGSASKNIFEQAGFDDEDDSQTEGGWSQVNGSGSGTGSKKWTGVVNGTATPASSTGKRTPMADKGVKDNKVAYILFYERVRS